jgi:hypothetical protein
LRAGRILGPTNPGGQIGGPAVLVLTGADGVEVIAAIPR